MAVIMKGAEVAARMKESLAAEAAVIRSKGVMPVLGIVRVGRKPDDLVYERSIIRRFALLEMAIVVQELPENVTQSEFDSKFMALNDDPNVHGILLFQPLPKGLSTDYVRTHMNPSKDIDGMTPMNAAKVFSGSNDGFAPCTASAVMTMLSHYGFDVARKNVVIVGRSMVIGRPLSMLMLKADATVTVCHSRTRYLDEICRHADILVAATGRAKMITRDYVSNSSVVVDVGINTDKEGNLCGDVDFSEVEPVVRAVSPVPGGVGAVTTSILAENVIKAANSLI